MPELEVDVEVRVDEPDGEHWWPGYLYRRDWEKRDGRWVCFVRYSATKPDGYPATRNNIFDADNIRPV